MLIYFDGFPDTVDATEFVFENAGSPIGFIRTQVHLAPNHVPGNEDFPVEHWVEPDDLFEDGAVYFVRRLDVMEFFEVAHGHYWDFASFGLNFSYTCLHGSLHDLNTLFFGKEEDFILFVFKFDAKSDAMLAKLQLTDFGSISSEDYRGLLGKTGQSYIDISV